MLFLARDAAGMVGGQWCPLQRGALVVVFAANS